MSDTVVNINDYRKKKAPEPDLGAIFNASDAVLDVMEQEFTEGVCVGILDNRIQVSATFDDKEVLIEMLEEALYQVRNEY